MTNYPNYLNLNKNQAAVAFQEFIDERAAALERLRNVLVEDGQNPDTMLDDTVESLIPLWRWIMSHLTGPSSPGATDPATVPRKEWPSWERYTRVEERVLSFESLVLLDGLISHLAALLRAHAPSARWEIAHHPVKRYVYNNHPVLVNGRGEINNFLPDLPVADARALLRGIRASPDNAIATYASAVIDNLNAGDSGANGETVEGDEPLAEVEDLGDDPLRGRELEVSLHEEIAHEYSRQVDHMVKKLAKEDGITGVIREDREVLLVATSTWNTEKLQEWVSRYLEAKIHD